MPRPTSGWRWPASCSRWTTRSTRTTSAGARPVSVALDRLVEDFSLDTLAYYHRGLDGEAHERVAAGMILGASLLTARGIPAAGEYELRTSLAMLVMDRLGAGGSFTEIQALNFRDGVVEMGHDGPAHLAISARKPLLRGLGVYHGKRGWGVSVEFDVAHGPVTLCGLGQDRDGTVHPGRVRGRGGRRTAAADRQHHLPGRLRLRPGRVDRRLERLRRRAPLGPRHRPPGGRAGLRRRPARPRAARRLGVCRCGPSPRWTSGRPAAG